MGQTRSTAAYKYISLTLISDQKRNSKNISNPVSLFSLIFSAMVWCIVKICLYGGQYEVKFSWTLANLRSAHCHGLFSWVQTPLPLEIMALLCVMLNLHFCCKNSVQTTIKGVGSKKKQKQKKKTGLSSKKVGSNFATIQHKVVWQHRALCEHRIAKPPIKWLFLSITFQSCRNLPQRIINHCTVFKQLILPPIHECIT